MIFQSYVNNEKNSWCGAVRGGAGKPGLGQAFFSVSAENVFKVKKPKNYSLIGC